MLFVMLRSLFVVVCCSGFGTDTGGGSKSGSERSVIWSEFFPYSEAVTIFLSKPINSLKSPFVRSTRKSVANFFSFFDNYFYYISNVHKYNNSYSVDKLKYYIIWEMLS